MHDPATARLIPVVLHVVAALPLLIWFCFTLFRGRYWSVSAATRANGEAAGASVLEQIVAVVPARNEADVIGEALASLLRQNLDTALNVILVDDNSTDATAETAFQTARSLEAEHRLTIINGEPLPPGWTGKLWALEQGVKAAKDLHPSYLLFTDADIRHDRESIAHLLSIAQKNGRDLASYMVRLTTATVAERLLIPAFVYFFFQLYPPAWVTSTQHKTAAAAGGCMLIRPEALRRAGGIGAIRHEVIDDCALASAVSKSGGTLWMGLTQSSSSIRPYGGFKEVGQMISRSAFSQLQHSYLLLAVTIIGLFLTYVFPVLLLFSSSRLFVVYGALAWLLMSLTYLPMVRFYSQPFVACISLPLVAVFYAGATVHSAWEYARGKGGFWKGRVQDRSG